MRSQLDHVLEGMWYYTTCTQYYVQYYIECIAIWFIKLYIECQNTASSTMQIGNCMEVLYKHHGKLYRIMVPTDKIVSRVIAIRDEHGNNVTNRVLEYAGPYKNFHGINTTPCMLGYEQLVLVYVRGNRVINEHDTIVL